jgi:glycosyltransferase involved in cell wall biosynthesis
VEQLGAGICVPHDDARAVGEAIRSLLTNPQMRSVMGARARSAHLQKLNYEIQFGPVMERVRDWLENG